MKKSLRLSSRNFAISDSPTLIKLFGIVFLLITTTANAGNYTWNGATSTNWSTTSNWSPVGVPSTNDTVTLSNGGVNSILLDGNRTITRLIISANTINLNTYELHVSGRSSLNGGAINNGNLKIRGTYAYFQGTNFNCTLDVIAGQIKFSGGTFDKTGSFEQNGSASGWGEGGCTFNDDVIIKNTGTVYLRMGQDVGDTFNGKVYLYSSGNYSFQIAYGDTSYFNDTIFVNSIGNGGISFANGTYGASILGDSACLVTGSTGISAGTIQFKNIVQSATSSNSITASGGVLFNVYSNNFLGKVNFTAPNLVVKSTTFGDSTLLTKTGHTLNNTWDGANVYNGVVTITNGNTSTAYVKLASQNADTYNKDVYFNAGTGPIQAANAGTNIYNGNVIVNGNNVTFNTSGGTLKFAGEENQTFGGGTNTLTFNKLIVDKAGGSVTLNQPITIDSLLQLTSGIIYTDTIITLKATATTTGASNLSFVDGTVKKIGNTAFVFPVGDKNTFFPVGISAPSNATDAFTSQYFYQPQQFGDSLDSAVTSISRCNYWSLIRNSGTSNISIKLYWDSLGCSLFDTSNLVIVNWNGYKWKNLSNGGLTGNINIGSVVNSTTISTYGYFTIGDKRSVVTVSPTLGFNRDLPEDFFGYNGNNTIAADQGTGIQTWDDIFNASTPYLLNKSITLARIPSGTFANFSDWRTGWPIPERDLPFNWFYDKTTYKQLNDGLGNEMNDMRKNLQLQGARPMLCMNMLTSKFLYELASIYRLQEVNLPMGYLELGNEFYLNDEYYKEIFPSVNDYIARAEEWANSFSSLSLPQTSNTEIAIIGADGNESSAGRRKLWLEKVLEGLSATTNIDAVTIHDYIGTGLPDDPSTTCSFFSSPMHTYLYKYYNKAFKDGELIKSRSFDLIRQYNSTKFIANPLEIWITEFNNLDDDNSFIGTWPHGLFNAAMALKYLETPEISKVVSHTMTSDAVFGNIFESVNGFDDPRCHGVLPTPTYTTRTGEFTALGSALDQVGKALRGSNHATRLDFEGLVPNLVAGSNSFPVLYGWKLENTITGQIQVIVINYSASGIYDLSLPTNTFPPSSTLKYEELYSLDYNNVIIGNAVSNPSNFELKSNINVPNANGTITLLPGSITRIFLQNEPLQARFTDDEICSGTTTTLIIEGGNPPYSLSGFSTSDLIITPTTPTQNDHVFTIDANSNIAATTNYNISISCSGCSAQVQTITVHNNLSALVIKDALGTPLTSPLTFCSPSDPAIQLTADFNIGNLGNKGTPGDDHMLWVPDSGLTSSPCGTNSPMCNTIFVSPKRTTLYTVYVNDEHCWQSRSILVEVPVARVDLGDDFNACADGTDIRLTADVDLPSTVVYSDATYIWTDLTNNTVLATTNSRTYMLTTPTSTQSIQYSVSVEYNGCIMEDIITVNFVACCTGNAGDAVLNPDPINHKIKDDYLVTTLSGNSNFIVTTTSNGIEVQANTPFSHVIIVNGDFHQNANQFIHFINCKIQFAEDASYKVSTNRTVHFENCSLNACNSTIMWDRVEVDKKGGITPASIILSDQSYISNAKEGVYLARESNYRIMDCTFFNNYKDIVMEKYNQRITDDMQLSDEYTISGNTFTSDGNTLYYPYDTQYKEVAIELIDVENVRIGKIGGTANIFEKSNFGIKMFKSGAEIWNNEFDEIFTPPSSAFNSVYGTAIYLNNDYNFWDRTLVVGEPTSSNSNILTNCKYGILGTGECNYFIENNHFGSDNGTPTTGAISRSCISIEGAIKNNISIFNENKFYDFIKGITLYDIGEDVTLNITGNEFYDAIWSTPTMSYNATAISIMNPLPNFFSTQALIEDNDIGFSTDTDHHSRIGVSIFQAGNVRTTGNRLNFHYDRDLYSSFCGIQLVNSQDCRVYDNEIINTNFDSDAEHLVTGVRVSESITPRVNCNTIQSMGYGIHFTGDNGAVTLARNNFTSYKSGISLGWDNSTPAFIGQIQGSPDPSPDGTGFKNQWDATSDYRVEGFTGIPISWYHDGATDYTLNNFAAVNSSGSPMPGLTPLAYAEEADNCATVNTWLWNRISGYSGLVFDSIRFDGTYASQLLYEHKQSCFKYFDLDSSLLEGDGNDTMYRYVFNQLKSSNIGNVQNVIKKAKVGEYLLSNDLNEVIEDTNHFETLAKDVMSIYLNSKINSTVFNAEDTATLTEIAYQNYLIGGEAVFLARAMLRLEIEDGPLGEARMMNPNVKKTSRNFTIQPNPAFDLIFLKYSDEENLQHIIITDNTGREIVKRDRTSYLSISGLNSGIYFVILQFNDGEKLLQKLIKLE
ncbi:MAG: T9SS type A sorting domain-containing protein [Bacteroidia bacterium]|jgi:hypothetical protein|nr:T9SS type A sorting domain-containing protein [Bacteroidia bacterium]MBP7243863.1 T9SS type A sorting domain-containing protein [Bacteroidia bacterium]